MTLMSPAWGLQLSDHRSINKLPWHPSLLGVTGERECPRLSTHRQTRVTEANPTASGKATHEQDTISSSSTPDAKPISKSPWPRPRRQAPLVKETRPTKLKSFRSFLAHPLSGDDRRRVVLGSRWRRAFITARHHWTRCSRRPCGGVNAPRCSSSWCRSDTGGQSWLLQELFSRPSPRFALGEGRCRPAPDRGKRSSTLDCREAHHRSALDEIFPKGAKGQCW